MSWVENLTNIPSGIFRTMNGNADELIGVGRIIKAGFSCSRVDVTNARYDAVVDLGGQKKLLRIQIKGIREDGTFSFMGGYRSGKQFKKDMEKRDYKYTVDDCDILVGVDSANGDCYIIPVQDIADWGNSKQVKDLMAYRENWNIFLNIAKKKNESENSS